MSPADEATLRPPSERRNGVPQGLQWHLAGDGDGGADALIQAVAEHRPDAVLTDIRMPPTHTIEGIDAAKRIRADYPDIGVVVLSQFILDATSSTR
jgi:YesN/AraC family two-component response regulator